jgi:hypothetical protein
MCREARFGSDRTLPLRLEQSDLVRWNAEALFVLKL